MAEESDLTGLRFGKLTVLREAEPYRGPDGRLYRQWLCLCDCGNTTVVRHAHLVESPGTRSCGCLKSEKPVEEDLTGRRFGSLTVICSVRVPKKKHDEHRTMWLCRCNCGACNVYRGSDLKRGRVVSCGCKNSKFRKERTGLIKDEISAMYRRGKSIHEIANVLIISDGSVRKALVTEELLTSPLIEEIKKLDSEGLTKQEIAERLGVSRSCVDANSAYQKGTYLNREKSQNAERIRKCREKKE